MNPFERFYKIGIQLKKRPDMHTRIAPVFTTEENEVLQVALRNYSGMLGRRLTQAEAIIFTTGWTSGIAYLGAAGHKIIYVEKTFE